MGEAFSEIPSHRRVFLTQEGFPHTRGFSFTQEGFPSHKRVFLHTRGFFFTQEGFPSHKRVFLTQEGFPETNQAASVNEFSSINGWTIFLGLFRISCPWGSSTGSLTLRFKSSGYHGWVLQTGAVKIRSGTHSCFIFRSTLEIILKGGNA